jgi:putative oxidoreductase
VTAVTIAQDRTHGGTGDLAAAVARLLLVILFVLSGANKLMAGPEATEAYFVKSGVPLPAVAYYLALLVELPAAVLFLLGWRTRPIALILAAWCIGTAVIAHSNFGDQNQLIHFMKNIGLAGGFLYAFAYGGGRYSIDGV